MQIQGQLQLHSERVRSCLLPSNLLLLPQAGQEAASQAKVRGKETLGSKNSPILRSYGIIYGSEPLSPFLSTWSDKTRFQLLREKDG